MQQEQQQVNLEDVDQGSQNNVDNNTIKNIEIHTQHETEAEAVPATVPSCVVRLCGLPYIISEDVIRGFFSEFELADNDPILHFAEGPHRGTGFVRLQHAEDVEGVIKSLHRKHITPDRYVELFASSEEERQKLLKEQNESCKVYVVRLRGIPFSSTEKDVREFLNTVKNVERIDICRDVEGRNSGDAFVQVTTEEDVEQARRLHNNTMGIRYIEVLHSTMYDRDAIIRAARLRARRDRRGGGGNKDRPRSRNNNYGAGCDGSGGIGQMQVMPPEIFNAALAPAYMGVFPQVAFGGEMQQGVYDRGSFPQQNMAACPTAAGASPFFPMFPGHTSLLAQRPPSPYVVRIRGLPYSASEETIAIFFNGVNIPQQGVHMVYNENSQPTGEAFVELEGEADVWMALKRSGRLMGSRYIEVFQSSAAAMQRLGGPASGMMGFAPYQLQGMGMSR